MPSSPAASLKSKILLDIENAKNSQALKKAKLGVKKFPKDPDFRSLAGFVLQSEGQYKKSVPFFLGAAKIRPRSEKDIENLTSALEMSNQIPAAEKYLTQTIARYPDILHAYSLLGNLLARQERWNELVEFATNSLSVFPEKIELLTLRGTAYSRLNLYNESFNDRLSAYELSPTHPMAARLFAQALHHKGAQAEAKKVLTGIVGRNPKDLEAIYDLSLLATAKDAGKLLALIEQISEDEVPEADLLHFARANLIKISKGLTSALPVYARANAIRFSHLPYEAERENKDFSFAEQQFATKNVTVNLSEVEARIPIFIVGQPRSGTTLLEMMLSSCEQVHGCGELGAARQFCKTFQESNHQFNASDAAELAQHYFSNLPNPAENSLATVDKMPHNYQILGYILSAIPNAKIVNILRDPRDTALSTWIQRFPVGGIRYANDLISMAHSANLYRRYMELWRTTFASKILNVQYEQLTRDPENVSKRIAQHCGINWDPAMISPERNTGTVKTASVDQVRNKISTKSIGSWQQAADELKPFLDELDFDLWPEYDL
ncbi:tetratricopeptide repeat-containing sulfotransferase family protein [Parasedimentitalea huanghaiensis]|uniref:Sulfotransferase family protein n=1 Tax=Parasedimentitalea huanghaiensis TaxID=2682100 RepID=A0A6L6WPD9_9RHOB|nr:sulfotransferase [Zongyanglinia huanghaiensis]MVO17482.1 sulfotransferase family protein [Zongyanglinia huanghaiensis]